MKIRNITENQQVDEINLVPRAVSQAVGGIKNRVAAYQQKQQGAAVAQNVRSASKAALQQWNNKVALLSQASGGAVDPDEYEDHLNDFVERMMLRSYKIDDLDPRNQQRVEAAIGAVVNSRSNPQAMASAFEKLVQQAMVSRLDLGKTVYQSPAAQKTVGPGAKTAPGAAQPKATAPATVLSPAQAAKAVATVFRASQVNQQALAANMQKILGPVEVQRTNNPMVNALLQSLGIQVK